MGEEWESRTSPRPWRHDAEDARHQLIDVVSNFDDIIMEKYLAEEPITADDLRRALRTATLAAEVVPVLCGSAFKNKGVQPMLDAVIDYLPSPLDLPPTQGTRPTTPRRSRSARPTTARPSPPWPSRS
jgi:elongation factor G